MSKWLQRKSRNEDRSQALVDVSLRISIEGHIVASFSKVYNDYMLSIAQVVVQSETND